MRIDEYTENWNNDDVITNLQSFIVSAYDNWLFVLSPRSVKTDMLSHFKVCNDFGSVLAVPGPEPIR